MSVKYWKIAGRFIITTCIHSPCNHSFTHSSIVIICKGLLCHSTSGTHGYMAIEIYSFENDHEHGVAADYFSLGMRSLLIITYSFVVGYKLLCIGVTMHEFLTGRRPFDSHRLQAFKHPGNRDSLSISHLYRYSYITGIPTSLIHVLPNSLTDSC